MNDSPVQTGTRATSTVGALIPRARVRTTFHASFANAGNAAADASGTAHWMSRIPLHRAVS